MTRRIIRPVLAQTFFDAWQDVIQNLYVNRRINSEATLQAGLIAALQFRGTMHAYIAPHFSLQADGEGELVIPDIVVCNNRSIIGVVEIKYSPRGRPNYKADVAKLERFHDQARRELFLEVDRYLGPTKVKRYKFSSKVLYVWAGVHRAPIESFSSARKAPLYSVDRANGLKGRFLALHAEAKKSHSPAIFSVPPLVRSDASMAPGAKSNIKCSEPGPYFSVLVHGLRGGHSLSSAATALGRFLGLSPEKAKEWLKNCPIEVTRGRTLAQAERVFRGVVDAGCACVMCPEAEKVPSPRR